MEYKITNTDNGVVFYLKLNKPSSKEAVSYLAVSLRLEKRTKRISNANLKLIKKRYDCQQKGDEA